MTTSEHPPFQPIRDKLYNSAELLEGYKDAHPRSMAETLDFKAYCYFVKNGRAAPVEPYSGMMQALHDNSIVRAMYTLLRESARPTAAIMGGHRESRGTLVYNNVVQISKRLTEEGFLMASGGGPGAMEATHLGALLAGKSQPEVEKAVALLSTQAQLPPSHRIVSEDGTTIDYNIVEKIHAWVKPAVELMRAYPDGGKSLAVPTWHYGHEPISPLASDVAKYFLNSIREDVLLALASNGIIFAEGRAGTLQEVFQDAAQNYYRDKNTVAFAPMVFLGKKFWEETLPVKDLLFKLFVNLNQVSEDEYSKYVCFTDDIEEAATFIIQQKPSPSKILNRMQALGFAPVMRDSKFT